MQCTRPVLERCKTGPVELVERPCGVCPACRSNKAQSWTYRLYAENKLHKKSVFVTLTYDEEHIKKLRLSPTGIYSLRKKDVQNFMKSLRKISVDKLRFYAAGEYGEHTYRPHYHLIIFGLGVLDRPLIDKAWQKGFVQVGSVSPRSIAYVARYCVKKLYANGLQYEKLGLVPEFSTQSNRPGIGFNAIEKGVHRSEDGRMFVWFQGKKCAVPKYFKDKIRTAFDVYVSRLRGTQARDERRLQYENDCSGRVEHLEQEQAEKNAIARRRARGKV